MLSRQYCIFNADILKGATFTSIDEYPKVKGTVLLTKPSRTNPFDRASMTHDKSTWLHFYVHDKRFSALYRSPGKYLRLLKEYGGVFGIDHSIYRDLPLTEQKHACT